MVMRRLLDILRNYTKEGFFHIFGSRLISQACGLLSSVVVIRFLEKTEYGYYVSANNLYSYPAIFMGLGMTSAILQYCSENVAENRKITIYRHSLLTGNAANFLLSFAIAGLAFWKYQTGKQQTAFYLLLMCGLPFVAYTDSYFQTVLRVKLKNKVFSYANIAFSVTLLLGNIILTLFFDIPGLVFSRYLAYLVSIIFCAAVLNREHFFQEIKNSAERLHTAERKRINNYAAVCAVTNFTSTVLTLLDVTCLELVLGDAAILADYHVAATIPSACTFIPGCLMVFFYPKLVCEVSQGKSNGCAYVLQLSKIYAIVNSLVYACLAIFAPLIIWIVYGEKYMNVVPLFEVLSVNYLVYCVRNLMGNTIAAIKKVKVNLLFAVISGLLNICFNLLLIPHFGAMGAAVATLIVTISISAMDCAYVFQYFRKK